MNTGAQLALLFIHSGSQLIEQCHPHQSGSSRLRLFWRDLMDTHRGVFQFQPIQVDKEDQAFLTYLQICIVLTTESSVLDCPQNATLALSAVLY